MTGKGWEGHPRVKAALEAQGAIVAALQGEAVDPRGQPYAAKPLVGVMPGKPVQWRRVAPGEAKGTAHNPAPYRKAKKAMARHMALVAAGRRWRMAAGPLSLVVMTVKQAPKVALRAHAAGDPFARLTTTTPDADNLAKLVMDAGNKLLWADDAQVVDLVEMKRQGPLPMTAWALAPAAEDDTKALAQLVRMAGALIEAVEREGGAL